MTSSSLTLDTSLAQVVQQRTGDNIYECYQCIKCTSGCPLADHFDVRPNQIMRAVQLGQADMVLNSRTIWMCSGCETCTTRCPQDLDIARVMDTLKIVAQERGVEPKVREVALFNKVFLDRVNILGRSYELGLMAEMNLRTGKPFKDLPMGLEMIRKGRINFLPGIARAPKRPRAVNGAEKKVAYYPGCSLHGMAREFDTSARAVLGALDVQVEEPEGWICCGSTAAHSTDDLLAVTLPMTNLAVIEQAGFREVTLPCAACYNRFKSAAYHVAEDPELKATVDQKVGYTYQGQVEVETLLDVVVDKVGLEGVKERVKRPLEGLKVACYYGCLLTRPAKITGAKHPEYPMQMDDLMRALGAEVLDWNYKTACCGASLSLTQTDLALELSGKILADAKAVGADAVAVACPLCHINLDARQSQMALDGATPVLYFTQLMALAFGLEGKAVLNKNLVDPKPLLAGKGLLAK